MKELMKLRLKSGQIIKVANSHSIVIRQVLLVGLRLQWPFNKYELKELMKIRLKSGQIIKVANLVFK